MRYYFLLLAVITPVIFAYPLIVKNNTDTGFSATLIQDGYSRPYRATPLNANSTNSYQLNYQNFVIHLRGDAGFNVTILRRLGDATPVCNGSPFYDCTFTSDNFVTINLILDR